VDVNQAWSGLKYPFSTRWPLLRDIPWFPAIGDGAAANLGSGCVDPKQVALTVGSTSALRVTLRGDIPSIPWGLWSYRVDKDSTLLGGALSEGGNILTWSKDTLRIEKLEDLEDILAGYSGDDHGLTFLPLLAGERSPGWQGGARGMIAGLSLATTPVDILVAALEGVALRIGLVYDLLRAELADGHSVIANGGALVRSPAWVQVIADVLGCEVTLSEVKEASARGAAMLALRSLGFVHDFEEFPSFTGREFESDPKRHEQYLRAKERQQRLYGFI
jgi:gluconokinase